MTYIHPAPWQSTDPARWLRGATSSGDPLFSAVSAVLDELAVLRRERTQLDGENLDLRAQAGDMAEEIERLRTERDDAVARAAGAAG